MDFREPSSRRFPALDLLRDELLAAAVRRQGRPKRASRLMASALISAVVLPLGFAIAQSDDDPVVVVDGVAISDGSDSGPTPQSAARPLAPPSSSAALPEGVRPRNDLAELWAAGEKDDQNVIGSAPPPERLLAVCRADASAEPSCGVALAMADGKLKPGRYSDAELRAAVERAGYEWGG